MPEDAIDLLVGWSRDFFDSRTFQGDLTESVLLIQRHPIA